MMDTFGFTQKKLMRCADHNRHRHIIAWLSVLYRNLAANRVTDKDMDFIYDQYAQVRSWLDLSCPEKPGDYYMRTWMEWISDAVQFHRIRAGILPKDHDLLQADQAGIPDINAPVTPKFDYSIALDGLRSTFNVGAVFRICDAAGFKSVVLGNTLGNTHAAVRKTSMGAHQWVQQETTPDLASWLHQEKDFGRTVIGIETVKESIPFARFKWPLSGIIVFGNEEYGISSHVLSECEHLVHIPMHGRKNSINVACAVSTICFHIAASIDDQAG